MLCFLSIKQLVYNRTYYYPEWSIVVGWSIGLSGVVMIPIVALYKIFRAKGNMLEVSVGSGTTC